MKALQSFTVRAKLPDSLSPLLELAMNLHWAWNEKTQALFRWIDPQLWEQLNHDPIALLANVSTKHLDSLSNDADFMAFMSEVSTDLNSYLNSTSWFQNRNSALVSVAYFSPEFGISEALPQYSGGLGILAGDHLKASSDLGIPLVGVGLFYQQGYFRQWLDNQGWQQENYPTLEPASMAVRKVPNVIIDVECGQKTIYAQIWRADVGRIRLYLLDTNIEQNDLECRSVTDRLYGGGTEHRLRQEILLGMGGVKALQAVEEKTQIFHTNEGHAGFLGLERLSDLIQDHSLNFDQALEVVRSSTIFTTHTPVPAGIDRFGKDLMEKYFSNWCKRCNIDINQLMQLGHLPNESDEQAFNMAVMGFRLAGMSNGVSKLHGKISREMFQGIWPEIAVDDIPIGSITNGIHGPSWASQEMSDLLGRKVIPSWAQANQDRWESINEIDDDEIWRVKDQGRHRLVKMVRQNIKKSQDLICEPSTWAEEVLDPKVLTIGFARRFASYKRATLLLSDPQRLKALLLSPDRPIQLVFAGKAHPADNIGKEMIRQLIEFSSDPSIRHRFVLVQDYDIAIARALYQGSDVWLNNPRRPLEACGTSGEKAALNGALNCSILDGWWDEMYRPDLGWAIPSFENSQDLDQRDAKEASSLFDILENEIIPLFYDRSPQGPPSGWIKKIKSSLCNLGPNIMASRMVKDYVVKMYEPTAIRYNEVSSRDFEKAKELANWKQNLYKHWSELKVDSIDSTDVEDKEVELGAKKTVRANIVVGSMDPKDIQVQLLFGPLDQDRQIKPISTIPMTRQSEPTKENIYTYSAQFSCEQAGNYGFNIRVLPSPYLQSYNVMDTGLILWA